VATALKQAGLTAAGRGPLDRHRAARAREPSLASSSAPPRERWPTISPRLGNTGTAHAGLMLADALERAKPTS